jgi:hypothetical protein
MLLTLPKGKPGIWGLDDDTPVKSDIPASANQQGYLEIDSPNMESLPTAPTVGK